MHLIVFPFFIYSILGAIVLLLWPQRGLSGKNYCLTVGFAMLGLALSFILVLILNKYLNLAIGSYFFLVVIPAFFAFLAVLKFGNSGLIIASKKSVLYTAPKNVLFSGLWAILLGLLASIPIAFLLAGIKSGGEIFLTILIVLPISVISTFALSGFISHPSLLLAKKVCISSSLIALALSITLGPVLLLGLPFLVYVAVATYVFVYLLFRRSQNLTNQSSSQAKPAGTPKSGAPN